MQYMKIKRARHILILTSILILPPPANYAFCDEITLKNGSVFKCVITYEDTVTVTAKSGLGRISFNRKNIAGIKKDGDKKNKKLLEKWKKEKLKKISASKSPNKRIKIDNGIPYIFFKGEWVPFKDYEKEKLRKKENFAKKSSEVKDEFKKELEEKEIKKLKAEAKEIISQHKRRYPLEIAEYLKENEWLLITGANFLIFSKTDGETTYSQIKKLKDLSAALEENFLNLKEALSLEIFFRFKKKPEIFILNEPLNTSFNKIAGNDTETYTDKYNNLIFAPAPETSIINETVSSLLLTEYIRQKYPKDLLIPAWIERGYMLYTSSNHIPVITKHELIKALRKNYYLKFEKLLALLSPPSRTPEKDFFDTESKKLVEFLITNYNPLIFKEFITAFIEKYNEYNGAVEENNVKDIVKAAINNSDLKKVYPGPASFKEDWLKYLEK